MTLSPQSLVIILFGVASVLATMIGARATHGWRAKLLWLIAVLLVALTTLWLDWPKLWPFLAPLWQSNALVVLVPVVVTALMRAPPPPPPEPVAPAIPAPPMFPRPKPRFRQPRDEAGHTLPDGAKSEG